VAKLTIAHNTRRFDETRGQWVDGKTTFVRATVWGRYGENVAETLTKGAHVLAVGRLEQRDWETRDGERRSSLELVVDEIGPALRYATAQVTKAARVETTAPVGNEASV
jgi:single-strand DNA-binding protein